MAVSCFDLLDQHVVSGYADDLAVAAGPVRWTYARLLEEVSAFGGVLRHCGVVPGDRVGVLLAESPEAVVAVLACARIGAEPVLDDPAAGAVLATEATQATQAALPQSPAQVVLVKRRPGSAYALREGRDYDWDVVLRAGRTDPAASVDGATLATEDPRVAGWADVLRDRGVLRFGP